MPTSPPFDPFRKGRKPPPEEPPRCSHCADYGFVKVSKTFDKRDGFEVIPCPRCNPDGFAIESPLGEPRIRCGYAVGGGGRSCYKDKGHKDPHAFECGK